MKRLLILLLGVLSACIKPPEIVVVDRATALEIQAGGSFEDAERELALAALGPGPLPLTPAQLEELGIKPAPLVDHTNETEAERVDQLLRQHCVGEGRDGLLVDTYKSCLGAADRVAAIALIDRANRARMQLWRWMHESRPDKSLSEVQRAWTEVHAHGVVCRGWVQQKDGRWEAKRC